MKTSNRIAYFCCIGAMLIWGTLGVFRRYVPLSSGLLAFGRGMFGSLFLFAGLLLLRRSLRFSFTKRQFLFLLLSGGLIGINWILLFEAYNETSVAIATVCYYTAPTFVILASPFLLHEPITPKKGVCAALALCGIVCISDVTAWQTLSLSDLTGIFLSLGAALCYAAVVLINKKVPVEDTYGKTAFQVLFATLVLLPYLFLTESAESVSALPASIGWVILLGIVHTGVAYVLYFGSLSRLPAQTASLLSYIDPSSAVLFSAVFLHEIPTPTVWIGALLVIGASFVCEIKRPHKRSPEKET